ncbi:BppU family phage baseplate upper protein [Carnobacterium maltaromaticum]|uniref:BppU family phage baseplate upper protein n=1 Tax=Carnobacterium maltaromaticum TaxID=2751 RepID=UPI0039B0C175
MTKFNIRLSTTEPNNPVGVIKVRQSNVDTEIFGIKVTENSTPKNLTGLKVYFNTIFDGVPVEKSVQVIDAKNGLLSFTLDQDCMRKVGKQSAYISFKNNSKLVGSTQSFVYTIQSSLLNVVIDSVPILATVQEIIDALTPTAAVSLLYKIEDLRLYTDAELEKKTIYIDTKVNDLAVMTNSRLNTKRDKSVALNMSDMGQDVKTAMTGGSVAVVGVDAVGTVNIRNAAVDSNKISDGYNFRGVLENNEDFRLLTKNGIYLALNNTKIPAEYGGSALVELKKGAGRWSELILTPLATTAVKTLLSKYRCIYDSTNVTGDPVWTLEASDFKGVVDNVNVDTIITSGTYLITNPKIEGFIIPDGNLYVMSTNGRFISQTLYGSDGNAYFRRWDNNGTIPKFKKLKIETAEGGATGATGANLAGQTVVNIGDSIFGALRPPHDISTAIADKTGAIVHNLGFGGCMMAKRIDREDQTQWDAWSWYALSYAISTGDFTQQDDAIGAGNTLPAYFRTSYNLLKAMDWSQVNIITCGYGTNDWTYSDGGSSIMLDNESDKKDVKTLLGAFRYGAELIWETYPHISIVVVSPTYRFWLNDDLSFIEDSDTKIINNQKLSEFVEGLENVSKEYKISFIDNYFEANINKQNRINFFDGKDGTHHNSKGTKILGRRIGGELMKVF